MMKWMIDNWYNILFLFIIVYAVIFAFMHGKVKEWLKCMVIWAEKELGSGTGQLKLREVYNLFIQTFPIFSRFITFSIFASWVDTALDWMKEEIDKNPNIRNYIYSE